VTDLMPEPMVDLDTLADGAPTATAAGGPDVLDAIDEQLLDRLVGRAREDGLQLRPVRADCLLSYEAAGGVRAGG